ncbi:MAG TPA: retroviral-like aspartic protease family protein [Burkholderiaceae bacterium]
MPEPTFDSAPNDLPPPDHDAPLRPPRSSWDGGSDRSHVKTFVLAASLMAAIGLAALAVHEDVGSLWRRAFGPPLTADEMRDRIARCERDADMPCAQETLEALLKKQPDDAVARAHLGLVMAHRDDDAHAVVEFQRAIDSGEGTYDLFAWYADSLARLGRNDEAIEWSYRSLSLVPNLVDVRGKLARLLVARGRPYEALSLLASYDADAAAKGRRGYFEGQRIAIESALATVAPGAAGSLRLPVMAGHFYAPVALGNGKPLAFMVDTGASATTVTPEMLDEARIDYRVVQPVVTMTTADGRQVAAQGITIPILRVGPYVLHDVPAVKCDHCVALLGQASLSHFDLRSTRTQGVEFLTLTPRDGD